MAAVPTQFALGEWRPVGPWIYAGKAFDVAVSPVDPNTVYAAFGLGGGLWKTADGGKTWLQLTDRSDLAHLSCITVHPRLPDVLVACLGDPNIAPTHLGLIYSSNGGRHWDFIGPGDGFSSSFYRAIFHPQDPNTIYAASEKGVYLTKDRGAHWDLILAFPGDNPNSWDEIPDLVMKPDDPTVLIAVQTNLGVFRTANGGATWTRVDQNMDTTTQTSFLAWSSSNPNIVYCERDYWKTTGSDPKSESNSWVLTYISSDGGITWDRVGDLQIAHQGRYDMAMAVDPLTPFRVILANADFGISEDGLHSYRHPTTLPHFDHLRVVFAPSDPSIVYSANDGGIWRSSDRGENWVRFDVGVNTNLSFGFDIDTGSGKIYLSPGDYGSFQYDPLDGWSVSTRGGEWGKFYIDPNDSTTVWYASVADLAVSHDRGQTWKGVDPDPGAPRPYRTVLRFHPTQKGTLFFLTDKIWVSHDSGTTWTVVARGTNGAFADMIADLAQPGSFYVSEYAGILNSTDGGNTWIENKSSTWGLPYYNSVMAPVPGQPGTFYMASYGVYLVSDAGRNAKLLSGDLFGGSALQASEAGLTINDLATDPAHPERLFVGSSIGLFFSQDYGQSWQRLGRSLPIINVWQISIKGDTIYAGTSQGIWQFSSDTSWQPPPLNFSATPVSASSIKLNWNASMGSAGVRIFRDGVQTYVGVDGNYLDEGLLPSTGYCYTALDTNANGDGPLSAPICVNTNAATGLFPSVAVSTTNLQFSFTVGGPVPTAGFPVQVTNGGTGTLLWTASASVPWLNITPTSGTAPSIVAIALSASAATLDAGIYTGSVSIAVQGAGGQSVPVKLLVNPPGSTCTSSLISGGQSFPASGGSGTVSVTANSECTWTASGAPAWITITGGFPGSGNGSVSYTVSANWGAARSGILSVAGQSFLVEQASASTAGLSLAGSMAQLASGGGWDTTLTLVNTGGTTGEALLNFLDNDGSPLKLPFNFSQVPSPAGPLVASTLDQTLNANSLLVLDSQQSSNPNAQIGSAQLLTDGSVGGFAIFKYTPTGQEAVVPLETRNAPSYVLAFDNTGVLGTGVAVANVATQAANIPVVIRDDTGAQIGTDTIKLAAQGHTSFTLTGNYAITKNKRGTIELDTPPSGQISALGLRANGSALTTLPVLANVTTGGGSMAQVASGGGWQTTFTLVNTGTASAQAQLSFFDNNGSALPLPLTFVQSGTATTASTVSQTIAGGATLVILTQGTNAGASVVGSAQLTTTGNVSGFAIFRYNPTGQEAVVPLETRNASTYVLAFDNTNGLATGVALANVSNQAANVPVVLRDDTGTNLGTATINLAAYGHTSFILTGSYPSLANKLGMVEFDTPADGQISVLGLRATSAGAVTTIPVLAK